MKYWHIFLAYGILALGIIAGLGCRSSCEELGCLACVVIIILALYASALFSVIYAAVAFARGKQSWHLLWHAPLVLLALYGLIMTLTS